MDRVIAAQVYLRICELGSLSAAARALGMSRPMVSRYLEQMESWAGARLIHRSTRRLTLTPAGEKVLLKTRGLTRIADEIAGERQRADPSGTLRVACAHFTAMQLISPLLPDFLARYPLLRLELDINNHPVSLIGERIDVAIRITDNPEAGAIARRLGVCRSLLCAAPRWLRQHGPLTTLDDLQQHNCLLYSHFAGQRWQFSDAQGQEASVAVNGNLSAGISSLLLEAAVAGSRPHALTPVDPLLGHLRRRKRRARLREEKLGVVVKAAGNETFQRLASQHDALEGRACALHAQHRQLTETQLIADTLRVLVCFGFCHHRSPS